MIRDPGPLHNIGSGVTSRDVPINENETEGIAPNSGYVSRALDNHPIMKFVASTAATMVVAGVLNKMTKQGGLRLGKYLQSNQSSDLASRAVHTAKNIREILDQLQGVKRQAGGVDNPLVFENADGTLTTGYDGIKSERFGYDYLTAEERRLASAGLIGGEPPAAWHFRDTVQQRLVRAGRRLPYEIPAFYVAQKGFVDPLFGERDQSERKTKWYNPADVIADFTTESVKNIATMILPSEILGAGATGVKNSLHKIKYGYNSVNEMSPLQQKVDRSFTEVSELLSEVGHDFGKLTNKILSRTNQTIGAFNVAAETYRNQPGLVQSMHRLKHGYQSALEQNRRSAANRRSLRNVTFDSLFKGGGQTLEPGEAPATIFDIIPSFTGMKASFEAGKKEFKILGLATESLQGPVARSRILLNNTNISGNDLDSAIKRIQLQHSSRLSDLAHSIHILGRGGPDSERFSAGQFSVGMKKDAFKGLLEKQLIRSGVSKKDAGRFVEHIKVVDAPKKDTGITKIITIGKTKALEAGDDADTAANDFFGQIIQRYRGVKSGQDVPGLTADVLQDAVQKARNTFVSREFKKSLNYSIRNNWNKFYRGDLHQIAGSTLKPKKALYQDFIGPKTEPKLEFLQRKTAETLGIKLTKTDGSIVSNQEILGELRNRGFDPGNFTDLRAFLIKNRQMTSGIFSGGQNLFGLQQVSIDEANDRGLFRHLPPEEQGIIRDIAGRMAINDPVSRSIGFSRLDGVYKTSSDEILDFTNIKSTFSKMADFFATEFKIPILGFNPADLFGYNSYSAMARRSPIQYVSSRSVQPFLGEVGEDAARPEFYMWYKAKGTKGKLIGYNKNQDTGKLTSETLPGFYRAIPTASSDLFSRHTRYGAAADGLSPGEIRDLADDAELGRGARARRLFNRFFAVDEEQPNSLFGLMSRFKKRTSDPNNPVTMARLLKGEEVVHKTSSGTKKVRLITEEVGEGELRSQRLKLVDELGDEVSEISESALLRGYMNLSREAFQSGTPIPVMKELEKARPDLFTFAGRAVSDLNEKELREFGAQIASEEFGKSLARSARDAGLDPTPILASVSRIKGLMNMSNLSSTSMLAKRSPTISTKLDELRNEIFRYISQTNQLINDPGGLTALASIEEATQKLLRSGRISAAQRAEAQAAGLATLFNMSAFSTYLEKDFNITSARKAAVQLFESAGRDSNVRSLLDTFSEGEIFQVGSSIRKRFSPLFSTMKRSMGTGGYQIDDLSIDPLGSGQSMTMLPTFGTAAARKITQEDGTVRSNFIETVKSAVGYNTYSNPSGFSGASIPVSQAVERLNRYFGTLGLQLDVSKFKGPLDLYMGGMVNRRVLPIYIAGTTAMTVDRTIGGFVGERDAEGERVYSPLVTTKLARGVVEAQSLMAGLIPGGMTYEEKKEQIIEGEVPIRQGRFWPLGNTPFEGGKIMYYRPSWYRKLQAGALFTDDTYGSPAEKFLFYNDISPLRPFDPYRFERKHYYDRPYPVTGEYFSGPFGPLTPLLNLTVGRILKPQVMMHENEVSRGLANYAPAGEFGAYDSSAYSGGLTGGAFGGAGMAISGYPAGIPTGMAPSVPSAAGMQSMANMQLASRTGYLNTASNDVTSKISTTNMAYASAAYGPPKVPKVMNPRIVPSGEPISAGGTEFQLSEFGYRTQEMLGIYGFAAGTLREKLGFGQSDFEPQRAVLQSASKAYGSSRAFWDLNLGGLGDLPISGSGDVGSVEFSEIVRRFIPKDRTNVDYINPISNLMGQQYPFLPGPEYYTNFRTGDPFTKVQEGEIRLPGKGYERLNRLYSDETGKYGLVDQLNILADVAPYSQQFRSLARKLPSADLEPDQRIKVQEILAQVEDTTKKFEFDEYQYKGKTPEELSMRPLEYGVKRLGEFIAHSDTFITNKAFGKKTALEDWERNNVYGTTFPQWSSPIEGYIQPMLYKATQRDPITAAAGLGAVGALFGRTPRARLFGTSVGITAGAASSVFGNMFEMITGDQFIPRERKKELALEEYSDILSYVKSTRMAAVAEKQMDFGAAFQYKMAAKRTMYGADIYGQDIETLSLAIPKRKREHFKALINAPVEDREKILQTSGRLERRIYQAAWGMEVEDRPDLNEYFTEHELPSEEWEGWHPNTNMDHIKIKTGQSMGLDMSQMGYYPQQIKEANLANPSYPSFFDKNDSSDVAAQLRLLMSGMGINGSVSAYNNPFGRNQFNVSAGVR